MNAVTKNRLTGIWAAIAGAQPPLQTNALNLGGKAESAESSVQVGPKDKTSRGLPPPPPRPGTGEAPRRR